MRKGGEQQIAEEGVAGGARNVAFHLGARIFDELVVLYAGGTRGHARHAAKAVVHVPAEVLVEGSVTLASFLHHVDASARRGPLFPPNHARGGREGGETA